MSKPSCSPPTHEKEQKQSNITHGLNLNYLNLTMPDLAGISQKILIAGCLRLSTRSQGSSPLPLGQKSCRTKVSRSFRIFVPNFAPNFAPNFPRIFRGHFVLHFVGDGDQKKITKNPRHFSMQNFQANTKKIFTKFFWRAGKVTYLGTKLHAS